MHALRMFVQSQMDERRWTQSDLAAASGITKQVVSTLLSDSRPKLDRLPQDKTIDGLARAFRVGRAVILAKIGEAMGLPVSEPVVLYDASRVSAPDLLRVLSERLGEADDQLPALSTPLLDTERGGEYARSAPITQARKDRATPTLTDETSNDYDTTFAGIFDGLIRSASAEVRRAVVRGLAEGDLVDLLLELLDPLLVEAHLATRGFLGDHKPVVEEVPDRSQFARVARPGVGDNPPDATTGEESQDPGSDEPA